MVVSHTPLAVGPRAGLPITGLAFLLSLVLVACGVSAGTSETPDRFDPDGSIGARLFAERLGTEADDPGIEMLELNLSETIDDITVTVNYAYFKDNQLGIAHAMTGVEASSLTDRPVDSVRLYNALTGASANGFRGTSLSHDSSIDGVIVPREVVYTLQVVNAEELVDGAAPLDLRLVVSQTDKPPAEGWTFEFDLPFIVSTDKTTIENGKTVEVGGVTVTLERIEVSPAEVRATLSVPRQPGEEELRPGISTLMPEGGLSDGQAPPTSLGTSTDEPGTYVVTFRDGLTLLEGRGVLRLRVQWLEGVSGTGRRVNGPWDFMFEAP